MGLAVARGGSACIQEITLAPGSGRRANQARGPNRSAARSSVPTALGSASGRRCAANRAPVLGASAGSVTPANTPRPLPKGARPQVDEQLVQLVERLVIPADRPGRDRLVERLLRRIPVVDAQPGPGLV